MIGVVAAAAAVFGSDGQISRSDGVIMFVGGLVYTAFLLYQSQQEKDQGVQDEYAKFGARSLSTKDTLVNAATLCCWHCDASVGLSNAGKQCGRDCRVLWR